MTAPATQRHPIRPALLPRARELAAKEGGSVLAALERLAGLDEAAFLVELVRAFAYATIAMDQLRDMRPAFDLLPFNQALERECAACRDADGRLWFVFADPFTIDGKVDVTEWVIELGGAYKVAKWPLDNQRAVSLDVIGGGRYWELESELTLTVEALDRSFNRSATKQWIDPSWAL